MIDGSPLLAMNAAAIETAMGVGMVSMVNCRIARYFEQKRRSNQQGALLLPRLLLVSKANSKANSKQSTETEKPWRFKPPRLFDGATRLDDHFIADREELVGRPNQVH